MGPPIGDVPMSGNPQWGGDLAQQYRSSSAPRGLGWALRHPQSGGLTRMAMRDGGPKMVVYSGMTAGQADAAERHILRSEMHDNASG
ncbi:MAG: hypothetical protein KGL39_60405, partial [Patescibacteria group bacterium]|nr:hypothetical protein [Patescibacteria group bacterium]